MVFSNRSHSRLLRGLVDPRHLRVLRNIFRVCHEPVKVLFRYVFALGTYPWMCDLRTPDGDIGVRLFSAHDVVTVTEIFCREDYPLPHGAKVIVDIGSNIGISALYFLTRGPGSFVYCFEPNPRNVARLRDNLGPFTDRYQLSEHAVGPYDGMVDFGVERTGRYGGIGLGGEQTIEVQCRPINDVLSEIIGTHGGIDLLKLDIEGLEVDTARALEPGLLRQIRSVCLEAPAGTAPDLEDFTHRFGFDTHVYTRRGQPR